MKTELQKFESKVLAGFPNKLPDSVRAEAMTLLNEFTELYSLSRRQRDCFFALITYEQTPLLAAALGVEERTIKQQMGGILRKLNCLNRSEALIRFIKFIYWKKS